MGGCWSCAISSKPSSASSIEQLLARPPGCQTSQILLPSHHGFAGASHDHAAPRGGASPHPRRAHRRQHRQIAGAAALLSSRPSTRNTPGPFLFESRRVVVKEHHRLAAFQRT
jgi:hypothetical protein